MLRKRLIGVITVKDGWAVQSFSYQRYLPLGRPERLAENLDRWGTDEILVLSIDRTAKGLGPDLSLLRKLAALGLSTPLTYGGGIRTAEDAGNVIQSGAERLCVDASLHGNQGAVREMAALVGAQAMIASLPLSTGDGQIRWHDYRTRDSSALAEADLAVLGEGVISEALVIDCIHEGRRASFDPRLVELMPFAQLRLIAFGGISEPSQVSSLLASPRVAAVAVGNFLNYSEHAVQTLKRSPSDSSLRPPAYAVDPER
ncbi:MAG: hypothetical protein IT383_18980 [Deltaproteobacteria bacterium]|nr:hypothetical protein [Deltaproteobacteria bacterium]